MQIIVVNRSRGVVIPLVRGNYTEIICKTAIERKPSECTWLKETIDVFFVWIALRLDLIIKQNPLTQPSRPWLRPAFDEEPNTHMWYSRRLNTHVYILYLFTLYSDKARRERRSCSCIADCGHGNCSSEFMRFWLAWRCCSNAVKVCCAMQHIHVCAEKN